MHGCALLRPRKHMTDRRSAAAFRSSGPRPRTREEGLAQLANLKAKGHILKLLLHLPAPKPAQVAAAAGGAAVALP